MQTLLCGLLGLLLCLLGGRAEALSLQVLGPLDDCLPTCVVLRGDIDDTSVGAFRQFVVAQNLRGGATIVLESRGGSHLAGINLGAAIRAYRFSTLVGRLDPLTNHLGPGMCASACVYALMGGSQRRIVPGSRVGVHQVRLSFEQPGRASQDVQLLMALAAQHLLKCGATADVVTLALATPPDELRWLSPRELAAFNVVNSGPTLAAEPEERADNLEQTIRYRLLGLPGAETTAGRASAPRAGGLAALGGETAEFLTRWGD